MARAGRASIAKRSRELAKQEQKKAKMEKRALRKEEKASRPAGTPGDPDLESPPAPEE